MYYMADCLRIISASMDCGCVGCDAMQVITKFWTNDNH
jgi:hypothetical protein